MPLFKPPQIFNKSESGSSPQLSDPEIVNFLNLSNSDYISADVALKNSDIYSIVNQLSSDLASVKLTAERSRVQAILDNPTSTSNSHAFWQSVFAQLLLGGEAFAYRWRNVNGKDVRLEYLRPSQALPFVLDDGSGMIYNVTFDEPKLGIKQAVPQSDVIHFRLLSENGGQTAISPLAALFSELKIKKSSNRLTLSALDRSIASPGVLSIEHGGLLNWKQKADHSRQFMKQVNYSKGGPVVLDQLEKYQPLEMKADVAKLLSQTDWTSRQIAKVFGVPDSYLNGQGDQQSNIDQIKVSVIKAGKLHFKVGTIDQHQLLVDDTDYYLEAKNVGINIFNTEIPLKQGQYLFLDLAAGLAELYLPSNLVETSLIQDESHISADTSYTGMQFYNVNYAVPFEYTHATQTQAKQLIQHEQLLTNLSSVTKDLSAKVQTPTLTNSKGEKFKIMVDDQGQLTAVNLAPAKVAIFGNSLTKNTGGIGMCATDQYHDWYYYFTQYLEQQNSAVTVNDRLNTSAWESATFTAERDQIFTTLMQPMLAPDTDLVILQLTDNVNTDAKKATYANDTKQLLKNVLSIAPKATIYWIVGWFGNQELYDQVQTACEQYDAHYLSIKDLNVVSNQGHLGDTITGIDGTTWQVTNPGAAAHPGNAGMKAIADRLISNLTF